MRMDETIGTMNYDGLIHDAKHNLDVQGVKIRAAQGALKRGTVLALSSGVAGDGKYVILGTAALADETLTASCILTDDVDATAEAFAVAYRSGHFNTNALIVKEGYTITAADKNNLRDGGVFLSAAVEL